MTPIQKLIPLWTVVTFHGLHVKFGRSNNHSSRFSGNPMVVSFIPKWSSMTSATFQFVGCPKQRLFQVDSRVRNPTIARQKGTTAPTWGFCTIFHPTVVLPFWFLKKTPACCLFTPRVKRFRGSVEVKSQGHHNMSDSVFIFCQACI